MLTNDKKIIVGICGAKQSGKDTVASVILENLPGIIRTKTGFMGPLKIAYSHISGYTLEEIEKLKNDPDSMVRQDLQYIADMGKRKNFKNLVEMLQDCINRSDANLFIITDLRFLFEAGWIKGKDGSIIRVFNSKAEAEAEKDPHHSERDFLKMDFDWSVKNEGSLADIKREAKWIAGHLQQRYKL